MSTWCKYPGCDEPAKYQVFTVNGIIRYSIDHCEQHRKWAVDYLERGYADTITVGDVGKGVKNEHTGGSEGTV
jgi:hypothetical protein